jgi:colicin import membrane protein
MEELAQKKALLQAEVQAKRDRRVAEQKKLEDGKRQHEAQQKLWAEREAKRREEEQKIKDAEEEEERMAEEAMAAEMEALERENEAEDEEMARLGAEREALEGMMGGGE